MKAYLNILIAFLLVFICNLGFSKSFGEKQIEIQKQEQEGERKSNTRQVTINPDGEVDESEQSEFGVELDADVKEHESVKSDDTERSEIKPAQEDDSVSKYNFFFYFLYKFKYDTAP